MIQRTLWRILNWPSQHCKTTILIAAILAIAATLNMRRLKPDTSLASMFSKSDKSASSLMSVFDHFPIAEEMLILVTNPDPKPQPEKLIAYANRLHQKILDDPNLNSLVASYRYKADQQMIDYVTKVVVPNGMFFLNDSEFEAARARLTFPAMQEQLKQNEAMLSTPGPAAGALAKVLLEDPLRLREFLKERLLNTRPVKTYEGSDSFLSPDGRSLLIRIAGRRPPSDLNFCTIITQEIQRAADQNNIEHFEIDITGSYPIANQSHHSIRNDSISSSIGSVVCLCLLFIVMFKRPFRFFSIAFLPVATGILYGFGVYAFVSRIFTPLSAVIGSVLAGIGIDYCVFYLVHYLENRESGMLPLQASQSTIKTIFSALFAAWITTVVGFVAIIFSSVRALQDFSIVGSLGLGGTLLGALFLLPALVVLIDQYFSKNDPEAAEILQVQPQVSPASHFRFSMLPLLNHIAKYSSRWMIISILIWATAIATLAIKGPMLSLESDSTVMHPRPNPALSAMQKLNQRMGVSMDSLFVHLQADSTEQLVARSHDVTLQLQSAPAHQSGVASTLGLSAFLPDPRNTQSRLKLVGTNVAKQVTADFTKAIAESSFDPVHYEKYKTFLNMLLTPVRAPDISDLTRYDSIASLFLPHTRRADAPAEAITLIFMNQSINKRESRSVAINTLRGLLKDIPGATLTGMSVLSVDTEENVQHDLPRLIIVAVIIIAAYLLIHFRSLTTALMAVLPTLFSLTILLFIARLCDARMNLANIVAVPLLMGMDVDYGIFLVSVARATNTRKEFLNRAAASSLAVVLCAGSTVLGFGSLIFTSVPAIRSLGWAVEIGRAHV